MILPLVLVACALPLTTVDVVLGLPPPPEHWVEAWGAPARSVAWQAGPLLCGQVVVPAGESSVVAALPRGAVTAVLAWPVWESGGPAVAAGEQLFPSGALWPVQAEESRLSLCHEDGAVVFSVGKALGRGADLRDFNAERLLAEVRAREFPDPWQLDVERLAQALLERSMRVSYIREVGRTPLELAIPEGVWIARSPMAPMLFGGAQELPTADGVTPYYDASGRRMIVALDSDGAFCAISPPD